MNDKVDQIFGELNSSATSNVVSVIRADDADRQHRRYNAPDGESAVAARRKPCRWLGQELWLRPHVCPNREGDAMLTDIFRKIPAALAIIMVATALSACGVNNIPTYEQNAKAKWSEVLNQYKRRADLVPNLVESVKGFAEQERSVLIQVTEARAKATSVAIPPDILNNPEALKRFQDAQNTLGGALRQLLVVAERYPDIKSGQNFLALQSQLEGTENRIAIARRDYIEAVRVFNTEITTVPGRFWTVLYPSAKLMATFDIPEEQQQVPSVNFQKKS